MRAGRLRHLVDLERAARVDGDYGEPTALWTPYDQVHAAIEPLRGSEVLAAQQTQTKLTHKVTVRYNSSIETQDRIKFGSRYLYINAIINIRERNIYLELMCTENAHG